MENTIVEIRKRSGTVATFNKEKISSAIFKALAATSDADRGLADQLADKVVDRLVEQGFTTSRVPSVENIQDIVEYTLIDSGNSDIAKAYIVYRHERRKLRDEKMKVINAKSLDATSKKFDLNCLRVLASRYLMRNGKNEITETPTEMFERVAILAGIGDMLYDANLFVKSGNHTQDVEEARTYLEKLDNFNYKFKIGDYFLNKWHFRSLINLYITLASKGQMKVSFKKLLTMLAGKQLDNYADKIDEYLEMMTSQEFLPNSPTMMNAGGRLGQLSCLLYTSPSPRDS